MAGEAGEFALEIGDFPVQHVAFASETRYHQGTLTIDRSALAMALVEPQALADIEAHLAHPGEACRIIHVLDALQPMIKVSGRSTVYPGHFGPAIPAGDGRTHRLSGLALLVSAQFPETASGALAPHEAIVEMSGPAAPYCAFSDTANVVLVCRPADGVTNAEFGLDYSVGHLRVNDCTTTE